MCRLQVMALDAPVSPAIGPGFEVPYRPLPAPPPGMSAETLDFVAALLYAIVRGAIPEELVDHGPAVIVDELERYEMRAHAALLFGVADGLL
jgi:hypothetical protein